MDASYHRHDINDKVWELFEPHLRGQRGQWGGIAQDNRRFINAIFWVLRTGAPWRDLPPDYGKRGGVHQRFIRWHRKDVWEKLLEYLDYYSNCRIKAKLKGLPPALHRQQALSAP